MANNLQLFWIFFKLGCSSFGGPIAHIGFFQKEFIQKRNWFSEEQFANQVSLCQFLPGPASSQLGILIGYYRAGRCRHSGQF